MKKCLKNIKAGYIFITKEFTLLIDKRGVVNMKITMTGKQIELTQALKDRINDRFKKLDRYFQKETEAVITLSVQREKQVVEATLYSGSLMVRVEEATEDMYVSIDNAVDILERQLRKHKTRIEKKLKKAGLAKVVIERFAKKVVVTIHTSRPGMIIGKNGADIEALRNDIKKLVKNDQVVVNIYEVRRPDLNAQLVAQNIAQQIEGRVSFKRAMKKAVQNAQKAGAQGIKVMCSGRLNGAEIARSEQIREGRIPLHTLRADIDYASIQAKTTYGVIGVKV